MVKGGVSRLRTRHNCFSQELPDCPIEEGSGPNFMSVLRGKGRGLELFFAYRPFEEALSELRLQLEESAGFYRGSVVDAVFDEEPTEEDLLRLRELLEPAGLRLETVRSGVPGDGELARRRAARPKREIQLSDAARSLVADFAGARADLAARRDRPLPQFTPAPKIAPMPAAATVVSIAPFERASATLYHVGTVRGGQSLHHVGNIVVVGDVNPGSELVASGDILVFGSLRGVAHAGAQGDAGARVYALELAATQLRIATFIAAEEQTHKRIGVCPEVACVLEGRITIAAHDRAAELPREDAH